MTEGEFPVWRQMGGPAFPRPRSARPKDERFPDSAQEGMSLRDWFAGQALAGAIAASANETADPAISTQGYAELMARGSYRLADAMLKAREESA